MSQWQGKSKGMPLGYRIFVAILSYLGLYPAYVLLALVACYYFLFSPTSNRFSYHFFRRRCGYGTVKAICSVYLSYFYLGQALIDKVAIMSGLANKFTSTSNGSENIVKMAEMKRGAIMLGAHLGNWEIAGHFISRYDAPVNIVMYDAEHAQIKTYMDSVIGDKKFNLIPIKPDLSHVYLMSEALQRGEIICMHADRFLPGNRTKTISFMGDEAQFPLGPFQLVKSLKAPYTFVYGVKTGSTHYDFYARPYREAKDFSSIDEMMIDYAHDLEAMTRRYPLQWFNYYDFWAKPASNNN